MSPEAILILGGLLLVAAAIFGGGFKIKEFEVPPVRGLFRLLAGLLGAILVSLGTVKMFALAPPTQAPPVDPNPATKSPPAPADTPGYVKFSILSCLTDEGFDAQYSESWAIYIDGESWGSFNNASTMTFCPEKFIELPEGQHSWELEGKVSWLENETQHEVDCFGQGSMYASQGDEFTIVTLPPWPATGEQCTATLRK